MAHVALTANGWTISQLGDMSGPVATIVEVPRHEEVPVCSVLRAALGLAILLSVILVFFLRPGRRR